MVDLQKEVVIRTLSTNKEFNECVALKQHVWVENFTDCAPASLMIVAAIAGFGRARGGCFCYFVDLN